MKLNAPFNSHAASLLRGLRCFGHRRSGFTRGSHGAISASVTAFFTGPLVRYLAQGGETARGDWRRRGRKEKGGGRKKENEGNVR